MTIHIEDVALDTAAGTITVQATDDNPVTIDGVVKSLTGSQDWHVELPLQYEATSSNPGIVIEQDPVQPHVFHYSRGGQA